MTMGTLIACSILISRALVLFIPFGQIFTRWQNAKIAMAALDNLMEKPIDHDPEEGLVRRSSLRGEYRIEQLAYAYDPEGPAVLTIDKLVIRPGERVALLGQIGAGKSTLLRLLAGMARPVSGSLLLDGTAMSLISPADVRREAGYLGQSAQLFLGTIRENILIGAPRASDEDILKALAITGGLPLVQNQSMGLDLMLQEGGVGLSGGQRQTLLLARTLLRTGNILLLDEPSAPLDEISERHLVQQLSRWAGPRTLVVTTNRAGLLPLVNRIVVMERGRVALDGPRDKVIAALAGKPPVAVKQAAENPA
jgi:ATP-binding cassette subfamily C protein LapB